MLCVFHKDLAQKGGDNPFLALNNSKVGKSFLCMVAELYFIKSLVYEGVSSW